jgi:hypothetical protein
VDHEVLVDCRLLQQDEMARGVSAEAPEAGDPEQPGRDDNADAAKVDRLRVEVEPVQACLGACEYDGDDGAPACGARELEDEDDEQDHDEDRCADADVHHPSLGWLNDQIPKQDATDALGTRPEGFEPSASASGGQRSIH